MKNKYTIIGDVVEMEIPYYDKTLICKFDLDDLEKVKTASRWSANFNHGNYQFYVYGYFKKNGDTPARSIPLHRLVMNPPKNLVVHHINHQPLDNRKSNLQIVTLSENSKLQPEKYRSTLYTGLSYSLMTLRIPSEVKETLIYKAASEGMHLSDYLIKLLHDHVKPDMSSFINDNFRVVGKEV